MGEQFDGEVTRHGEESGVRYYGAKKASRVVVSSLHAVINAGKAHEMTMGTGEGKRQRR